MWKTIEKFPKYECNELGQIRNKITNQILNPGITKEGYLIISLRKSETKKTSSYAHRLVAQTFIPNIHNKPCINHINGIKTDNRVENLEWVTHKENTQKAFEMKLMSRHPNRKPVILEYDNKVIEFESISLCAEYLNTDMYTISRRLHNQKDNSKFRNIYKIYYKNRKEDN